jgi:hypothetical protein
MPISKLASITAIALFLTASTSPSGQQSSPIKEPLLPSDVKQCGALNDEYQRALNTASQERGACIGRTAQLPGGYKPTQTNKACLAELGESLRDSLAFTCNEDRRCSTQNTAYHELAARRREATESCYAKVMVYKAVEQGIKETAERLARDTKETLDTAAELRELAKYVQLRDLELVQEMEARASAILLRNQKVARAFHQEAMKGVLEHAKWANREYEAAMQQVFSGYLANQQMAWKMAQASAANDSGTRLSILRGQSEAFSSAYTSTGGNCGFSASERSSGSGSRGCQ